MVPVPALVDQCLKETCIYLDGKWQTEFFSYLACMIQYGYCSARKADTGKAKVEIRLISSNPDINWNDCDLIPYLDPKTKYGRGVQHPSITPLLCTASFIDKFKSVDANVRLVAHEEVKRLPLKTTSLFGFLYSFKDYQTGKFYPGFLRGYLLVHLWQSILVKPTAALELSEAIGRDGGNAVRDGINTVTIESIAYIACQVFFMLTTHNTWSHTVGGFNLFSFYCNIITIFKAGPSKWQEDTLDWWNREVLQPANSIGDEPEEGSDMALALAQAAAEATEAEAAATAEANVAAANPTPSDPAHGTQAA
ncbi:hypothetical protein Moror_9404 [Moniliophthora roreri MCA 2997]|uniref:Uncharacterized protein n=1 Tax=Moniliophthora roreri (strain MCA 2997) TaxID=1381753 RepID=V2WZR3_MONRO|nr:hypothetical protein Moror_9404 [Moniliophthora roreri MCA 2997]